MVPKILRARTAARLHLRRLWQFQRLEEHASVPDFLASAPDLIAEKLLNVNVLRPTSIPGGNEIAGLMDRRTRTLSVASGYSIESQRFTLAHEIGHWVLHTGQTYFRDRSLSAPDQSAAKPYYETEADAFAAELLMPPKYVTGLFEWLFGGPIDGRIPNAELALSASVTRVRKFTADQFAQFDPMNRARAIAGMTTMNGVPFTSLANIFRVSVSAMAIQLLDLGLVR